MAFYINAYNILAIKVILRYNVRGSIMNVRGGKIWGYRVGKVGGKSMSLDHVEKKILLKKYKDPRIHFAVVCASVSCPDLRTEPYTAAKLETQLSEQTATFLKNPKKAYLWT